MPELSAHRRIVERLVERFFNRPVMENIDRSVYVQCMIEVALREHDQEWEGKLAWDPWNLEHQGTGACINVRQSAKLQTWWRSPQRSASAPGFNIKPTRYWGSETGAYLDIKQRWADLYALAHHAETQEGADQRLPEQWEFYLAPERNLPGQKSIGLGPLRRLAKRSSFRTLGSDIIRMIDDLPRLKADSPPR